MACQRSISIPFNVSMQRFNWLLRNYYIGSNLIRQLTFIYRILVLVCREYIFNKFLKFTSIYSQFQYTTQEGKVLTTVEQGCAILISTDCGLIGKKSTTLLNFCFSYYLRQLLLIKLTLKLCFQKNPQNDQAVAPAPKINPFLCSTFTLLEQHFQIPNISVLTPINFLYLSLQMVLMIPCLVQKSPFFSMNGQFLNRVLQGIVIDIPPNESSCIYLRVKVFEDLGY